MSIKFGSNTISTLKLGSNQVEKIYLGSTELWSNYTLYNITPTLSNVTASSSNPTTIGTGETKTLTFTTSDDYTLPSTVSVSGATATWSVTDCYSITATTTNCTASASNPSTIASGGTATLVFTFDGTSYKCPSTAPSVTGATGSWTKNSDTQGTMVLSSASGNVSFSVEGEEVASGYTVTITTSGSSQTNTYNVYDGTSTGGTYLGYAITGTKSFTIESGNIYLVSASSFLSATTTTTGGITLTINYVGLKSATVTGNGTMNIVLTDD